MKDFSTEVYTHSEIADALHGRDGTRRVKFRYDLIRDGVVVGQLPVIEASVRYKRADSIHRTARFKLLADRRAEQPLPAFAQSDALEVWEDLAQNEWMDVVQYRWGAFLDGTARQDVPTAGPQSTPDEIINWLTDRIKPVMLLRLTDSAVQGDAIRTWGDLMHHTWADAAGYRWGDFLNGTALGDLPKERWAEFPLGVFVPSTPTREYVTAPWYTVEAYDLSVLLREDCVTDRAYFAAGTRYLDAVTSLLVSAGVRQVESSGVSPMMGTDHEWEIGTSKLEIVNQLLDEANYNALAVDEDGVFVLSPYREPTAASVTLEYVDDALSVLYTELNTQLDLYNVPNVFVGIVSNPDRSQDSQTFEYFRYEYVNDDPTSKLSTVRRGRRIVEVLRPNDISSAEELEKYVRRRAFEAAQVYEMIQFSTALMPVHGDGEILRIQHPDLYGIYEETGWEMDLTAGGTMTHEARKIS